MKRFLLLLAGLLMSASMALADTATFAVSTTSNQQGVRDGFTVVASTLGNRVYDFANATATASGKGVTWPNAMQYTIGNVAYKKNAGNASLAPAALGKTFSYQTNRTTAIYVFTLDSLRRVNCTKGAEISRTQNASATYPTIPAGYVPFAAVKVSLMPGLTARWAIGNQSLGATGVVTSWESLSQSPGRLITE